MPTNSLLAGSETVHLQCFRDICLVFASDALECVAAAKLLCWRTAALRFWNVGCGGGQPHALPRKTMQEVMSRMVLASSLRLYVKQPLGESCAERFWYALLVCHDG
jgi:hypothetical protein